MSQLHSRCAMAVILLLSLSTFVSAETPYVVDWAVQLGTTELDGGYGAANDASGNVVIVGSTKGSLYGPNTPGERDAYVSVLSNSGSPVWSNQFGTGADDHADAVTVDTSGNILVTGYTRGSLAATNIGGMTDAFLRKYNAAGSVVWTRQLGTAGYELSNSVTTDAAGNVFISGYSTGSLAAANAGFEDAIVTKYLADGTLDWTRQFGGAFVDSGAGLATDSAGNLFVTGSIGTSLSGNSDVFLRKYTTDGSLVWSQQFGTTNKDFGFGVVVDGAGDLIVTGATEGDLAGPNSGSRDAFVSKYSDDGSLIWSRQFGTGDYDTTYDLALDPFDNIFVCGFTQGDLGAANAGFSDLFVTKYKADGTFAWTWQLGSADTDHAYGISTDAAGNVFITGRTDGDLLTTNLGDDDLIVIKLIPEPGIAAIFLLAAAALLPRRRLAA